MKKVYVAQNIIPNYREVVFHRLGNSVDLTVFYSTLSKIDVSKGFIQKENFDVFKSEIVPSFTFRRRVYQFSVLKKLLFQRPDVLIAQNLGQLDMIIALFLCKVLRVKFYWWHGGTPFIDGRDEVRGLVKFMLGNRDPREYLSKYADGVFVYSEHAKTFFERKGYRNCIVAPNSPNTNKFVAIRDQQRCNPHGLNELKSRFAPNGEKIILLLGRLDISRRTEDLIRAFAEILREGGENFSLVIIGDGSERRPCEALCSELQLSKVYFEGAIYDDDTLAGYFGVADFFVTPGVASMAIKIAMTFGVPVITADYGLEVHVIREGINGFVYPIGEYSSITEIVLNLSENPAEYSLISKNAELTIARSVNLDKMIEGFLKGIYID